MIKTRIATTEDIEKISHVLAAIWKSAYRGIVDDNYLDSLRYDHWVDFLTAALNGDVIFVMVLEENQEIIGASIIGKSEKENEAHIRSLYLLPDKIGRGYGHAFYSEIEKEIIDRGFSKCLIDVLSNNKRAIGFYEAHGFADTSVEAETTLGNRSYTYKVFERVFSHEDRCT